MRPRYRTLLLAALRASALCVLFSALAHVALITWVVDRSQDASLAARLGLMFGAPIAVGAIPSALAAALGAWAWRRTWGSPLATWRWGLVMASALLPALAVNVALGPTEEPRAAWVLAAMFAASALLPALAGAWLARSRWGFLAGAAAIGPAALLSRFLHAQALEGLVLAFACCVIVAFAATGWLMERAYGQAGSQ